MAQKMSLFIEVYVGNRDNRVLVAETHAYNISSLADLSDYEFTSHEFGNARLSIPATEIKGDVKGHKRKQSVWALVAKIAGKSYETT